MFHSLRSLAVGVPVSLSAIAMLVGGATGSAAGILDFGDYQLSAAAQANGQASPFVIDVQAYFASHPELFAKVNASNACPLPPPGPLPFNCHRDCENIFNNGGCPVCTIRCDGSSNYEPCPPVELPTVGRGCYTKCTDNDKGCPICVEECYDLGEIPPPPAACPAPKLWPVGPTCANKCSRDANGCTTCVEECFQPQQAPPRDPWVDPPQSPDPWCPEFRKDDLGPGCFYSCKTGVNGCPDCSVECPAAPEPACKSEPFAPAPPGCFYNCSTSPDTCPVCNLQCDPWANMPAPAPAGNCHTGPFDPVAPGCFYDCHDDGNGCWDCPVKCW